MILAFIVVVVMNTAQKLTFTTWMLLTGGTTMVLVLTNLSPT